MHGAMLSGHALGFAYVLVRREARAVFGTRSLQPGQRLVAPAGSSPFLEPLQEKLQERLQDAAGRERGALHKVLRPKELVLKALWSESNCFGPNKCPGSCNCSHHSMLSYQVSL